ncbi:MAG: response regulator [Maritimibacter sp.]|jgi:two-component system, OmpR family, response regulator BaeR
MTNKAHILIVEDEPALAKVLEEYLVNDGFSVSTLDRGTKAVEIILDTKPDLVVLDLALPGKDGVTICEEVRAHSTVPIIMETARAEEIDRLLGLNAGADDYMCKPFSPRELVARVHAVLRRSAPDLVDPGDAEPEIILDHDKWTATVGGAALNLSRREFQILSVLMSHPGRVYSRQQILEQAFSDEDEVFDRVIDSHIKNLRQKFKAAGQENNPIRSVYGVGYALGE